MSVLVNPRMKKKCHELADTLLYVFHGHERGVASATDSIPMGHQPSQYYCGIQSDWGSSKEIITLDSW